MFAKLLKYEWKASAPLLGTLSVAALGVGLLSGLVLRLSDVSTQSEMAEALLATATVLTMMFLILALAAYSFSATLLLLHRFYKNKFTDQGYLTFTLPVSSHQIFLSSWLNLLLWQVISMAVVILTVLLTVAVGGFLPDSRTIFQEMQLMWQDLSGFWDESTDRLYLALYFFNMLTTWLYGSILTLTCIVLGAAWAKKHKLLLAFGLYYGVSGVASTVTSIVTMVLTITNLDGGNPEAALIATSMTSMVVSLVLGIGGYFLSTYMMSRRLNLS